MLLKTTKEGITLTIPYKENANYKQERITKGLAYNVICAWSEWLSKRFRESLNKLEQAILARYQEAVYVSESLMVLSDGTKLSILGCKNLQAAIDALETGLWKDFLMYFAPLAMRELILCTAPEEQKGFTLAELSSVLLAADKDCIE